LKLFDGDLAAIAVMNESGKGEPFAPKKVDNVFQIIEPISEKR
jgi:hypothetical protein